MPKFQGKVAVVTGGSSGIGLATAKRFVEEGAFVYITGRRQTEMDKAVSLIGHSVTAVQADVSNLAGLDRLYDKLASEKGKIDILFAGAGIVDPQPLAETTEESFDKVFAINTRGLAFTVKKALPLLNDGGAIIVITSIAENKGIPGYTAYSATKAAVRSFVRTWTAELKDRRIRVNAISPGPIDTPIFDQQAPTKEGPDQARAQFAAAVPFGRLRGAQATPAAALSWLVAVHAVVRRAPSFAPVAAFVCLGITLGQRLRRVIEMIVGVGLGVGVGDLLSSAIGTGPWQIALVVALAMSVAVLLDGGAVITVQSAVSAILIVTLYLPGDTSGLNRLVDGLIGGVTGLVVVGVFPRSACPGSVVVAGTGTRGAS